MNRKWTGIARGVAAVAAFGLVAASSPASEAKTRTETTKKVTRQQQGGKQGYLVNLTERIYCWEPYRNVVAIYRRITDRWLDNLRNRRIEGSGRNEDAVRRAASNVGYSSLRGYVQNNVRKVHGDSNGIVLLDPSTGEIVGIIPVSGAGDAHNFLHNNYNKSVSTYVKGAGRQDIRISAYVWHASPILLDLGRLGKPDLLAGPDWRLAPGRQIATAALRAFDLDGSGGATWEWVGPQTGILVWDPDLTGTITSGKQLFGNYTWGDKFVDGYEALGRLDHDSDGHLTGPEIEKLAIWVDANSDARSEPSEVKRLADHGIVSIAVQAQRDDRGNAHADRGFVRKDAQGRAETLATWDWIAMGQARPTEGTYVWVGEHDGHDIGGYLHLADTSGTIEGLSYPTVGHDPDPRYIMAIPVAGKAVEPGKVVWSTPVPDGKAVSEVVWDPGGKHLYGRTQVATRTENYEYNWQAELIAGDPIGAGMRASLPEKAEQE